MSGIFYCVFNILQEIHARVFVCVCALINIVSCWSSLLSLLFCICCVFKCGDSLMCARVSLCIYCICVWGRSWRVWVCCQHHWSVFVLTDPPSGPWECSVWLLSVVISVLLLMLHSMFLSSSNMYSTLSLFLRTEISHLRLGWYGFVFISGFLYSLLLPVLVVVFDC